MSRLVVGDVWPAKFIRSKVSTPFFAPSVMQAVARTLHGRQTVLYITFDGLLEPLGQSQVLKYVCGLARRGIPHVVLSLERTSATDNRTLIEATERELAVAGVTWVRGIYHGQTLRNVLGDLVQAYRIACAVFDSMPVACIHARSYLAALVACALQFTRGVPYVFDMRGNWVEEKAAQRGWPTGGLKHQTAKRVEKLLLQRSASIITLTEVQANDLRDNHSNIVTKKPLVVIPTCCDYDAFTPNDDRHCIPMEVRSRIKGKLVVGFVGSVNPSYKVAESLRLFRLLLDERPDAYLLCLTRQTEELQRLVWAAGIPAEADTITSAEHMNMPDWLSCLDWALLLLSNTEAQRGAMPTKLAEFLASGVRLIQYGGNSEISRRVLEAQAGIVLNSLSDGDLKLAASFIARAQVTGPQVDLTRQRSRPYFGLENGLDKYHDIITRLMNESGPSNCTDCATTGSARITRSV
jgi:glycosyltransferase involved in cell wall biosynthesis